MRVTALLAACCALSAASLAQAGVIATDTYSCDPNTCLPPTCLCASYSPPGGLAPAAIPQFILLSHDNALNAMSWTLMQSILGSKRQRNSCPIPVTWFAMRYHSDCEPGRAALARGDELAMQANRFTPTDPFSATDPNPHYDSRDPVTREPSVEVEITMSRKWWHEECGIPLRNMVGFRAQEYVNNPPIRQTLSKDGFLYDATLIERYYTNSPTSPAVDQVLWPYTMDSGIPQECGFLGDTIGKCAAGESYRGLWEAPLYQLQQGDVMYGVSNYGDTRTGAQAAPDLFALFKSQLDQRLAGGRTPLTLSTFYEWLGNKPAVIPADDPLCIYCQRTPNSNAQALAKFIDYAASLPDVWFITTSDLLHWMQDPVPAKDFAAWWDCKAPGVKANLAAVNLSAADLAGANTSLGGPAASPPPAQPAAAAPTPAVRPTQPPATSPATAPATALGVDAGAPCAVPSAAMLDQAGHPAAVPSSAEGRGRAASLAAAGAAVALGALLLLM